MSDDRHSGLGTALAAFAVGALVGAAVALLLAPQSGQETRERLRDFAREAEERLRRRSFDGVDD